MIVRHANQKIESPPLGWYSCILDLLKNYVDLCSEKFYVVDGMHNVSRSYDIIYHNMNKISPGLFRSAQKGFKRGWFWDRRRGGGQGGVLFSRCSLLE